MPSRPPVLALKEAAFAFTGKPLFEGLSLAIHRDERAALVGRNGSGKSSLLKCLAGLVEIDRGEYFAQPGLRIAYLPQEESVPPGVTVAAFVGAGLAAHPPRSGEGESRAHLTEKILRKLMLDGARTGETLSGGEARRASLARALVGEPEVLLLDEPTNHLDLPTIEWLEKFVRDFPGGVLTVSHDRAFLDRFTAATQWLVLGRLYRMEGRFRRFEAWSEDIMAAEERKLRRLDTRIAEETHWLHRGITARRKRNRGRARKLAEMRKERGARSIASDRVKLGRGKSLYSGRLVIDAEGIRKSFPLADGRGEKIIAGGFSTRILRGDRLGLVGPNGAGKTTLLRLLAGDLKPDSGRLRLGPNLVPACFDQGRAGLDPKRTLWETLCEGGGDHVFVQGKARHVVGYLKDFLFDEKQAKSLVETLSGGERNRLLLAKILARPANLLILDEPTNDLDMDTLDLLQEMLSDYDGTLLVVSHDRDFLNRLVTSIIAVEGDGVVREYVGGYDDYLRQRKDAARGRAETGKEKAPRGGKENAERARDGASAGAPSRRKSRPARLGYKEQRELDMLPGRIEELTANLRSLEERLADGAFYLDDREGFEAAAGRLEEKRRELKAAEERWLELESLGEELARAKAAERDPP